MTEVSGDNYEKAREAFFKHCYELGEQEGRGENTSGQFALDVIREAHAGTIQLATKRGSKNDDAVQAYNQRMLGLKGKSLFKMKERSLATRHAVTRSYVRLGSWPHGGQEAILDLVFNRFVPMWEREASLNRGQIFSIDEALARLARKQCNLQTIIADDNELRSFIYKPAAKERSVVQEEEAIAARLERLIAGEGAKGKATLFDDDEKIQDALDSIRERIRELSGKAEEPSDDVQHSDEVSVAA